MTRLEIDMLRGHFAELVDASQSAHAHAALVKERHMCVMDEGDAARNARADQKRRDAERVAEYAELRAHERLCGFFEGVVAALATTETPR